MAGGLSGVVQGGKPYLQPGKMRHKVQIVQPSLIQDAAGGWNVRQNTVLLTTWASIEPLTASEKFAAHEFTSNVSHKIWLRDPRSALPSGVTASMQIFFDNRVFQIEGPLRPHEISYAICLMCVEIDQSKNEGGIAPPESSL